VPMAILVTKLNRRSVQTSVAKRVRTLKKVQAETVFGSIQGKCEAKLLRGGKRFPTKGEISRPGEKGLMGKEKAPSASDKKSNFY